LEVGGEDEEGGGEDTEVVPPIREAMEAGSCIDDSDPKEDDER
jgi:hypothetical protein